jgi:hypothetical protein
VDPRVRYTIATVATRVERLRRGLKTQPERWNRRFDPVILTAALLII